MCDIATLFNTNTTSDLCCFDSSDCATYLCGAQNSAIESGNGTTFCYLDQAIASDSFDNAPNGTCGNMACALRALSSQPSVTVDLSTLPTSYSSAEPSASSTASTSSMSSGANPVAGQGMTGLWLVAMVTLAMFGKKLQW
ncbi:uncharacterized protein IL334_000253 [Kwoniella shivajii]|uniref:Apple domain-containing protein n=1 Tax=Kwoniella shivajii TaxID=564305 RepID=A0ABZ1CNT2_9TREE|nr:hypothetical protein IL334_000253 [Kwoniella shivajii]